MSSADEDGNIVTWDLAEAKKLQSAQKHKNAVWSLAYSSGNGSLLASGTESYRRQILCIFWQYSNEQSHKYFFHFIYTYYLILGQAVLVYDLKINQT